MENPKHAAPPAWIVADPAAPAVEIWGLTPEERLRRALAAVGCERVARLGPGQAAPAGAEPALLLRADCIYDGRLIEGLLAREGAVLVAPDGGAVAAHVRGERVGEALALLRADGAEAAGPGAARLARLGPRDLVPAWDPTLRKSQPPYLYRLGPDNAAEVERRLFAAAYKGATDLVTKWLWPRPAAAATRLLARAHVHPNAITLASWVLALAALGLFLRGSFGAGLVAAWGMTFLDTVDGKLARVTLRSSRLGHVLDHGLDLVHPPFWWLAWGLALAPGDELLTAVVVGGYFVGRALEGVFLLAFDMEIHCWRPLDSLFRTITARRNPNLILLSVGTLGGRPDLGFAMVALWTAVSVLFHALRTAQAFAARARGETIAAWDEAAAPQPRPSGQPQAGGGGRG